MLDNKREIWVDRVKLFACILVVLGHFFQSMVRSEILPGGLLFQWFDRTIYMFHVPLFFICSGYLYQKTSCINSLSAWGRGVIRRLISLGVPYFVFSMATWVLKNVFSSSVNTETDGLIHTLFIIPESPYWYLYILFFLFVFIPTFNSNLSACLISAAALFLKLVYDILYVPDLYFLSGVMNNGVWFVIGMLMYLGDIPKYLSVEKRCFKFGISMAVLFLTASVFTFNYITFPPCLDFVLGIVACTAVVTIAIFICKKAKNISFITRLTSYTFPIFLLHTIFAAGFRAVLLKFGISNPIIHIVLGLCISFIGPIVVAEIARHIKFINFFFYPNKYIFIKGGDNYATKA